MKIKSITFGLENCDVITIKGKYIGAFLVDNLKTSIYRIASNAIKKMDVANTFVIEIHRDANKKYDMFGQKGWNENTVFERLTRYSDITSIDFDLEDQYTKGNEVPRIEHYDYYVNWTGNSDEENDAQKTYLSNCGNLYLVIDANKNIEDFFDKDDINNEQTMDFQFSMCDVGDTYGDPNRYLNLDDEEN